MIYSSPAHQSPVHGSADDLLLLPGYGFSADDVVVYQQLDKSGPQPATPTHVPAESTAKLGIAQVVSNQHVPYSLTIRLPDTFVADRPYALWVHSTRGEWSNPARINDPRPLWLSPAYVFASQSVSKSNAGLRYLKVIGRNLRPAAGHEAQVRLQGPQQYVFNAESVDIHNQTGEHVLKFKLPPVMQPGAYRVSINRDGQDWVSLRDQLLNVRSDPRPQNEFDVSDVSFGECRASDNRDDANCILRAIAAASINGGTVHFGPGTWDMTEASAAAMHDGLRLPSHVSLQGAGPALTTLIRHESWNQGVQRPAFTLEGDNQVSGFTFRDSQRYTVRTQAAPFLQLGHLRTEQSGALPFISNVVIANNVFDRVIQGIADSGAPIRQLFITNNVFGAYHIGLRLAGDLFKVDTPFRIDDAVITHNQFFPGSWLDVADHQGAMASELGAGFRVDFSDNIADGSDTRFLNSESDAHGWRAGFFWHMNGNQEQVLVSDNVLSCTGDKAGDGEAISFDNNGNTFAIDTPATVIDATPNSITISASLLGSQNGRPINRDAYYVGHWVQIGQGPGLGQARKIVSYQVLGQHTLLRITPAWDVTPVAGTTRINIGREFWQVQAIGNRIDHRQPLCQKSNRNTPKGGGISLFAQFADSVVAGNQQYDSDGIVLQNQFSSRGGSNECSDCYRGSTYISSVEIHHNLIDGEYDWPNDCSSSGILASLAASPNVAPLTTTTALVISHNQIRHADATRGGAIAMTPSWFQGPPPHQWPLIEDTLVHHNQIEDMWSGKPRSCGSLPTSPRTGISIGNSSLVWHSILYANSCAHIPRATFLDTDTPTHAHTHTLALCKSGVTESCECQK